MTPLPPGKRPASAPLTPQVTGQTTPRHPHRRPRAEDCDRLSSGELRRLVGPEESELQLADGTLLALRWAEVRGCFGGRPGRALVIVCPHCGRCCRVIWRPPGMGWACGVCRPLSHASHRRPGWRRQGRKPPSWHLLRIEAEQQRIARSFLGIAWPPGSNLLWSQADLLAAPIAPGSPQLRAERRAALVLRLEALEVLRLNWIVPLARELISAAGGVLPAFEGESEQVASAERALAATAWAIRRPPHDPRYGPGRAS